MAFIMKSAVFSDFYAIERFQPENVYYVIGKTQNIAVHPDGSFSFFDFNTPARIIIVRLFARKFF